MERHAVKASHPSAYRKTIQKRAQERACNAEVRTTVNNNRITCGRSWFAGRVRGYDAVFMQHRLNTILFQLYARATYGFRVQIKLARWNSCSDTAP